MSYSNKSLQKLRVVVTRPLPQGEELCTEITAAGGEAIYFPTIEIVPPTNATLFENQIAQLEDFNWVIFISPQSVSQSAPVIHRKWPAFPERVKVAAIGAATAKILQNMKFPVTVFPKEDWRSEGLLDLPEFENVTNKKIAIISGEGGRELLEKELSSRGAAVTKMAAYRRALPQTRPHMFEMDIIVCTSNESVTNLTKLLGRPVLKTPLLVVSERMIQHARELGFQKIFLAKNAGHAAILQALFEAKGSIMSQQLEETIPEIHTSKQQSKRVGASTVFLSMIILALAVAFGAGSFYLMNQNATTAAHLEKVQATVQDFQQNIAGMQQQAQQWNDAIKAQTQAITTLQQSQGDSKNVWAMLEAQYLVKLANDNLQFDGNLATVISLLQTADVDLRDLADPRITSIRETLATDIASLQAVKQVDIVGVYARLAALSEQTDKLPLPTKLTPDDSQAAPIDENLSWWRRGLQQTWRALSKVVIVRYNPNGTLPLITPEQQDFLYENFHAVLEKAMWALLHKQPEIYRSSLQQASDWTKKYFLQDSQVTQAMLTELNALQQIDVRPDAPKTLASVAVFQDYFNTHKM